MSVAVVFTVLCVLGAGWMIWNGTQAILTEEIHWQRGRIERSIRPWPFAIVTGFNLIAGAFLLWAAWFSVQGW